MVVYETIRGFYSPNGSGNPLFEIPGLVYLSWSIIREVRRIEDSLSPLIGAVSVAGEIGTLDADIAEELADAQLLNFPEETLPIALLVIEYLGPKSAKHRKTFRSVIFCAAGSKSSTVTESPFTGKRTIQKIPFVVGIPENGVVHDYILTEKIT